MKSGKRKGFRKTQWAVVNSESGWVMIESYQEPRWTKEHAAFVSGCYSCCRPVRVEIHEITTKQSRRAGKGRAK